MPIETVTCQPKRADRQCYEEFRQAALQDRDTVSIFLSLDGSSGERLKVDCTA